LPRCGACFYRAAGLTTFVKISCDKKRAGRQQKKTGQVCWALRPWLQSSRRLQRSP